MLIDEATGRLSSGAIGWPTTRREGLGNCRDGAGGCDPSGLWKDLRGASLTRAGAAGGIATEPAGNTLQPSAEALRAIC